MRLASWFCLFVTLSLVGCSKKSVAGNVPSLHPVKGMVYSGGQPVSNGDLSIVPLQSQPNLMVSATIKPDGSFEVFSMDTQDREGKKHPGAPEGSYRVSYRFVTEDQTVPPVEIKKSFVVEAKANEWVIELKEKKP